MVGRLKLISVSWIFGPHVRLKPCENYINGYFFKNIKTSVCRCDASSKTKLRTSVSLTDAATRPLRKGRKKKTEVSEQEGKDYEENLNSVNKPPKLTFPFNGPSYLPTEYSHHDSDVNINYSLNSTIDSVHKVLGIKDIKHLSPNSTIPPAKYPSMDTFIDKEDSVEGRYYLFKGPDMEQFKLPSVTTVLQTTIPSSAWFGLWNWRKNMIKEHGEKGYHRIRNETIRDGTNFHQLLEERLRVFSVKNYSSNNQYVTIDEVGVVKEQEDKFTLVRTSKKKIEESQSMFPNRRSSPLARKTVTQRSSQPIDDSWNLLSDIQESFTSLETDTIRPVPPVRVSKNYRYSESVKSVLRDVTDVMVIEGVVRHEELGFCGTVDCVAHYKGELCVIEWKTSNKPKPHLKDLHDYPLQISAYAGALNTDPNYNFKVCKGLIVVAYPTGSEAHVHSLDSDLCLEYWNQWLDRLNQFQTQFAHDLTNIHI